MNNQISKKIIEELKRNRPGYVSGEALSERMSVSRTAIWKHIKELKDAGYGIDSSSKKGYRLIEETDLLNEYEISSGLETDTMGKTLLYYQVIDSTNTCAKKLAGEGCADGTVIVADIQTSGRGRLGREWVSAGGKGIWMSIVLRPSIQPEEIQIITLAASVAVTSAIGSICGLEVGIKWPNDVLIQGKKVCGILTEMNAEMERVNYIVLGIGINVNHDVEDFPETLREVATSLRAQMSPPSHNTIRRSEIIRGILVEFEKIYKKINTNYEQALKDIICQWKSHSVTLGRKVRITVKGNEYIGTAVDITYDGKLVVHCDDGEVREVLSGEVSVRGLLGYT